MAALLDFPSIRRKSRAFALEDVVDRIGFGGLGASFGEFASDGPFAPELVGLNSRV
jgi:hypothetical protein